MSIVRTAPFMARPALRHKAIEIDIAGRSSRLPFDGAATPVRHLSSFLHPLSPMVKINPLLIALHSRPFPQPLHPMQRP
jgi:hypothetical protein